jgi:hypothetical protein
MRQRKNVLLIVVDQRRADVVPALGVVRDAAKQHGHFAALPPLFCDVAHDPHRFENLAEDPAHAGLVKTAAPRALSRRMRHAGRTPTHCRATPRGPEARRPAALAHDAAE